MRRQLAIGRGGGHPCPHGLAGADSLPILGPFNHNPTFLSSCGMLVLVVITALPKLTQASGGGLKRQRSLQWSATLNVACFGLFFPPREEGLCGANAPRTVAGDPGLTAETIALIAAVTRVWKCSYAVESSRGGGSGGDPSVEARGRCSRIGTRQRILG